ncbi:MAG: NAD(P)/FAD-dependent oxidoreductase [Methanosarcinales archaeon]|nr:NAD(P)/FAD-dependent oxidoreductase [Methanosarcinales archaeon]
MNRNTDADIVVIGASPAGIMAAREAARRGASVILVDAKEDMGKPPHPANTFFRFMMERSSEPILDEYVVNRLKGMKIISPSGIAVDIETPGYFIDRGLFDRHYQEELAGTGVDMRMGVEVLAVIPSGGVFTLSTSCGLLVTRLVIAADGIESKTAARMGLNTTRYPGDIAWAMEAEVRAPGIGEPDMFEYYIGRHSPGWKSTYSPAGGDRATLGVYVRRQGRDVSAFFDRWLKRFATMKGYSVGDIEIKSRFTGGDPIATVPKQLVADGFMVTGGAAGQSGIGYGMRAGQICGEVAAAAVNENDLSKQRLKEYQKRWKGEFASEYWMGRMGLELVRKMTDKEIDTMVSVFAGRDLSSLSGTPIVQGVKTGLFVARHKPAALWVYRALLRWK